MAQIIIPCETYVRMAKAAGDAEPLNCLHVESSFLVATDRRIMAVQLLRQDNLPAVQLSIDPVLIAELDKAADQGADYIVDTIDGVPWATGRTSNGYTYPGNALQTWGEPPVVWRDWTTVLPEAMPKKPSGSLFMVASLLARLGESSPSGEFVFPEFINNAQPTLVRDIVDPNWFGLFISRDGKNSRFDIKPALYPEWLDLGK